MSGLELKCGLMVAVGSRSESNFKRSSGRENGNRSLVCSLVVFLSLAEYCFVVYDTNSRLEFRFASHRRPFRLYAVRRENRFASMSAVRYKEPGGYSRAHVSKGRGLRGSFLRFSDKFASEVKLDVALCDSYSRRVDARRG